MTEVTRSTTTSMTGHPDLAEMRERYERVTSSNQAVAIDGLVMLAGLWLAVSPWVVHFTLTAPNVAANNLIMGLAVAIIGLGLAIAPTRMFRLSWATVAIGGWQIVSQWVIEQSATDAGIAITNVISGGVTALLGLGAVSILMAANRERAGTPATRAR